MAKHKELQERLHLAVRDSVRKNFSRKKLQLTTVCSMETDTQNTFYNTDVTFKTLCILKLDVKVKEDLLALSYVGPLTQFG